MKNSFFCTLSLLLIVFLTSCGKTNSGGSNGGPESVQNTGVHSGKTPNITENGNGHSNEDGRVLSSESSTIGSSPEEPLPDRGSVFLTGQRTNSYSGIVDMPPSSPVLKVTSPSPVIFSTVYSTSGTSGLFSFHQEANRNQRGTGESDHGIYDAPLEQHSIREVVIHRPGDYFLSWTLPLKRTDRVRRRSAVRSSVFVNGIRKKVGVGDSSYIRMKSGHNQSSCHLNTVLHDLSGGDRIQIRIHQTTSPPEKRLKHLVDGSFSLYLERVPRSVPVFSGTATRTTRGKNFNRAPAPLQWIGNRVDGPFEHNRKDHPENVTIRRSGLYLVCVNIPLQGNNERTNIKGKIRLDGEPVKGRIFQQGYIRKKNGHRNSSIHYTGFVRTTHSDETLTVTVEREANGGTVTTGGRNATLFIRPLPEKHVFTSTAETVTGNHPENWNPKKRREVKWTDVDQKADSLFKHSTDEDPEQITIRRPGDYLFVFNAAWSGNRPRVNPELRVLVNGTPVSGATSQTGYIRGSNGHSDASEAGIIFLPNRSPGDTVSLQIQQEASSGPLQNRTRAQLLMWKTN